MTYQIKSFVLKMIVVLGVLLGAVQLMAFVAAGSTLLQTLLVAVPCLGLAVQANEAEQRLTRQRRRHALQVVRTGRAHAA